MEIRRANAADAKAGSAVLRRSIAELCSPDHRYDPAEIAAWTANKTPETWLAWLRQPGTSLWVAVEAGRVLGVSMLREDGEILLNYVSPEARFAGVSKALLARMEAEAQARGLACCTLESTRTARRFYRAAGYEEEGDPRPGATRMRKRLAP